ncbi:MAG: prepilin-type N-terminal cleavage/methylation domain-containing protein [Desulfobacteraceae bacterium]|nr:prepilin-type N-terminal cleavage/methylation domain-containing protein [Desulfobacteraceae bacterium]
MKKTFKKPFKDTKGFTLMELMVVIAIVAVLAAIAVFNYIPTRARALDSAALSDSRNIVSSVVNSVMNNANVDFNKGGAIFGAPGAVGALDTAANPRTPIFTLSIGVVARITGDSIQPPGASNTVFSAFIYHTGGTTDPTTLSGKKEFFCFVDADAGISSAPN